MSPAHPLATTEDDPLAPLLARIDAMSDDEANAFVARLFAQDVAMGLVPPEELSCPVAPWMLDEEPAR